jgi:hypothetical protein
MAIAVFVAHVGLHLLAADDRLACGLFDVDRVVGEQVVESVEVSVSSGTAVGLDESRSLISTDLHAPPLRLRRDRL